MKAEQKIEVVLNRQVRDDISIQLGGSLSQTSAHKSKSSITVSLPADQEILECDYLELKDKKTGTVLHAGTVLGVEQIDLGYSEPSRKVYALTISSNADFIANLLVDMTFPAGASIQQILRGNLKGMPWYEQSLGEFQGVFAVRIAPEGITLGTMDEFSSVVIEETASLWGVYVSDLLDQICSAAGAWWEITPDKLFCMRYAENRPDAPIQLNKKSAISNLQPSRDAYTLYSAVRVVGGQGKGPLVTGPITSYGSQDWKNGPMEVIDPRTIKLKYPLHSMAVHPRLFGWPDIPFEAIMQEVSNASNTARTLTIYKVGTKGKDDDNPEYGALADYGSDTITLKDSAAPFKTPEEIPSGKVWKVYLHYYPLVPVVTRMVDDKLQKEIQSQRGGSGIIEAIHKDDTLTNFSDATLTAMRFLQSNAKRAKSVSFKTFTPGWHPGQRLSCELPYYGLTGDYEVGAVTASLTTYGDEVRWEYKVEASTVPYRDSNLKLFERQSKITVKLGGDFPAVNGAMLRTELLVQTRLAIGLIDLPTWEYRDGLGLTWSQFESDYESWTDWEEVRTIKEMIATGSYLTSKAKERLAKLLSGATGQNCNLNGRLIARGKDENGHSVEHVMEPTGTLDSQNQEEEITTTYYINADQAKMIISSFDLVDKDGIVLQSIPVNIDKTPSNPLDDYALTITKIDKVL